MGEEVICHTGASESVPTHNCSVKRDHELISGVSEINHETFALEEPFDELLTLFHLTDRQYEMGWRISSGSQCLSSSFWLKTTYR